MNRKHYKSIIIVLGIALLLLSSEVLAAGMGRGRGAGAAGQGQGMGRGARRGQLLAPEIAPNAGQVPAQRQLPQQNRLRNQTQTQGQNQDWITGYRQGFADGLRFAQQNQVQRPARRQQAAAGVRPVQPGNLGVAPNMGQGQGLGRGLRQGRAGANAIAPNAGQRQGRGMRRGPAAIQENAQVTEPNF